MKCPDCGNTNLPTAVECEFCGRSLVGGSGPRQTKMDGGGQGGAAGSPNPAKRRTMYEPGPPAGAPESPRSGDRLGAGASAPSGPSPLDPFSPAGRRLVPDPLDPFGAAVRPAQTHSPHHSPPQSPPGGRATPTSAPVRPGATVMQRPPARYPGGVLVLWQRPSEPAEALHPDGVFVLYQGRNTLGRDEGTDVRLDDGKVSGQHGFVFLRPDGASFIDVSTNGSVVDGKVLHGQQAEITTGSVIQLGGTFLVYTQLASLSPGALPPSAGDLGGAP